MNTFDKNAFMFGVQYYRAPTPSGDNWESDLKNIKDNGFNTIKFWVQWGWTHRGENEFYFEDIDRLMDIAYKNQLKVTLNVIFDVAPIWIFNKYPESKIVLANGKIVEPRAVGYRQIGGFPATCYNHKESFDARMLFLRKTAERYKDHPAMDMWDIWNEPEQCGPYRYAKSEELPCFCDSCKSKFKGYLKNKYNNSIESLNDVWGRCYRDFNDVQLPTDRFTFSDFIDFREFHLDNMTEEANSRIRLVKDIDKKHPVYLHVVPNTSGTFNALTGVDDFDMAKECDVFASTNFAKPIWSILTTSAGKGKICYNVECHIGNGSTKMHQKQITLKDMVKDLLPQIGMGIRGFMFWQYRPEVLGIESPAWGVTKPDGSIGSVGVAAKEFINRLLPYTSDIMKSKAPRPEIAIWKGRKNELLSFCINNELQTFAGSIESYANAFYYSNYNCCIVNDEEVINGLDGIKLLVLPHCYEADRALVKGVDKFLNNGGTVICESHFGGYDADRGRHSYSMPGVGASNLWGIEEVYTTSSYHLSSLVNNKAIDLSSLADDEKKAIDAYGLNGGKNFNIRTVFGFDIVGSERFAKLSGGEVIGTFNNEPCIVRKKVNKGTIYYCGSNIGEGSKNSNETFVKFISNIADSAGIKKNGYADIYGVHVDVISDRLIIINNNSANDVSITMTKACKSLYFGDNTEDKVINVKAGTADFCILTD